MPPFDLPHSLPVFPLPGALLLPRARLPLQIFEPRYVTMLEDVLKTPARLIGMVQPQTKGKALHGIGCAGRVAQFSETEDGRYMILLLGVSRYRLQEEIEGSLPYRRFRVSWSEFAPDRGSAEHDPDFQRADFLQLLARYFDAKGVRSDWDTLKQAEDEFLINSLAMVLEFKPEDKQALLEAPTLAERRKTLRALMEFHLHGGGTSGVLQ
ncbi:MAG: LON peptidase substrate-binding domain-containing protein [Rhodobacteraceae bacterium]|nr:LON peptidase substrate-binding domain-containing protein [Paracoccaceae bacterium]